MTIALVVALLLAIAVAAFLAAAALGRGRRLDAANDAVVALARAMSEDGGSREHLAHAVRRVAGADMAFLAEPDRREPELTTTAATDPDLVGLHLPLDEPSLAVETYLSGEPVRAPDLARAHPGEIGRRSGARAAYVQPVQRAGRVVGVLGMLWTRPVRSVGVARRDLVEMLAAEAARAIERDARYALLARQARTDELTALPNRRAWDEAVERELSRAERTLQPVCLALLDLDHFKAYNDTNGHQAGDTHLRRTAAAWRRELRTVDVLARYGGEEFGILLPATSLDAATEAIDRVRAATPHGETASAGVVQWDGRESGDALLARADAALYRAKDAGRALTLSA